ncbi:acyltransferase family protein [Mucilaginibacter sp. dw_454]|uniref:acyltransferase n=1 Tax=Mucilaginibacter sp. dw_454 TaxID=2720079 RepID=UPI001BD4785B|nr:acyltransferase family protein [Mucilaginibacter sp. dw_454]
MTEITTNKRHYGFDVLRVLACYMVMQIHTGEFYYIGNGGAVINSPDSHMVGWYNSAFRACVPLFVMLSGYFMFPIIDTGAFFKKRLSRVAIPFVLWSVLYAFYYYFTGGTSLQTALINICKIPVNYGVEVGHLWFVYMLLGIYLFAPLISAWVQTCSRRNMEFYLLLWVIAFSVPYIHLIFPAILGECYWNHTPTLYYFSGFLGYVILANYIKRFHLQPKPWNYAVGALLIIVGYFITAYVFETRLATEKSTDALELTWGFETINVAMIAAGIFLILKNISFQNTSSFGIKLLSDVSAKSYGMYLAHIMILIAVHNWLDPHFVSAAVKLPLIAGVTFVLTYLLIKALSYLPKSKWLVG